MSSPEPGTLCCRELDFRSSRGHYPRISSVEDYYHCSPVVTFSVKSDGEVSSHYESILGLLSSKANVVTYVAWRVERFKICAWAIRINE